MTAPRDPAADEDLVQRLRTAWSRRPTGVAVLTSRAQGPGGGVDLASAVTDIASTSLHPPMLLVCVYCESRLRDSLDEGETWALSFLDASAAARAAARQLGEPGRPLIGQLTGIAHRRGEASGAALLEPADAWIECRTAWVRNAGDHDVVVADVLDVTLADTAAGAIVHHLGRLSPSR